MISRSDMQLTFLAEFHLEDVLRILILERTSP